MIELLQQFRYDPSNKDVLDEIFSKLGTDTPIWYYSDIFELIYLKEEYKEYTEYLLDNKCVLIGFLDNDMLSRLLIQTSFGLNYILKDLNDILDANSYFISYIVSYLKNKPKSLWKTFLNKIKNREDIDHFMFFSVRNCKYIDEEDIIQSFYNKDNKKVPSSLPNNLMYLFNEDEKVKNIMIKNADLFFECEKDYKYKIYLLLKEYLSEEVLAKYKKIIELFDNTNDGYDKVELDEILTKVYNEDKDYLNRVIKEEKIEFLNHGTQSYVYKIGNNVIKISNSRYESNSERDFFMIVPNSLKKFYNEDSEIVGIIEIQPYLKDEYNGKKLTEEDVDFYLNKLDEMGYEITDPNCVNKKIDNFGFLSDYHQATLLDYKSSEDLPEWFKERPMVLLDVDLIYKKDYSKKKKFSFK